MNPDIKPERRRPAVGDPWDAEASVKGHSRHITRQRRVIPSGIESSVTEGPTLRRDFHSDTPCSLQRTPTGGSAAVTICGFQIRNFSLLGGHMAEPDSKGKYGNFVSQLSKNVSPQKNIKCPICHNHTWTTIAGETTADYTPWRSPTNPSNVFATIPLVCKTCGFVAHFSSRSYKGASSFQDSTQEDSD